jgi:hypothetical protein
MTIKNVNLNKYSFQQEYVMHLVFANQWRFFMVSFIRGFFSSGVVVATADRIRSGWSNGRADNLIQPYTWYKG